MISTATALTSACASRGSGPRRAQTTKRGDAQRRRPPARSSRETGRPAAGSGRGCAGPRPPCRTIWASSVSRADRARPASRSAPVPLTVPPITRSPGVLLDRDRLAGDHRLVDRARPFERPRRRPGPSRPAGRAAGRRPALGRAARPSRVRRLDAAGRLGREAEQRPDRARWSAPRGLQLQHLAEQDERDDDRRRLEVDADTSAVRRGTTAGKSPGRQVATRL